MNNGTRIDKRDAEPYYRKGAEREAFAELYALAYSPKNIKNAEGGDSVFFGGMKRAHAEKVLASAIAELKRFNLDELA